MGITQQIGASSLIKPGVIDNTAARPASPYEGQVIFQKDTDQLLVWNGTAWVIPNSPAQNPMGLELIKTQTVGSAVSSVTVSDVFSSIYDNYKIIVNTIGSVAESTCAVLGTSTAGYYAFLVYGASTGAGTVLGATRNNTAKQFWLGGCQGAGAPHVATFDLMNPFNATFTRFCNAIYHTGDDYGTNQGEHRVAASYTSITISPSSGTFTGGTIQVYGYRK